MAKLVFSDRAGIPLQALDLEPDDLIPGKGENEAGLFAPANASEEADDAVYARVEERMANRRKRRQPTQEPREADEFAALSAPFKTALRSLSEQEWASLPEATALTVKRGSGKGREERAARRERFLPVPDAVLASSSGSAGGGMAPPSPGSIPPAIASASPLAAAPASRVPAASALVRSGIESTVDPQGYLTGLQTATKATQAIGEEGEIRRARLLLKNAVTSNPQHAPSWLSAARLEEACQQPRAAKALLARGLEACPGSAELWLEAIRLETEPTVKRSLLARAMGAVRGAHQSLPLWLQAIELADVEDGEESRLTLIQRALENLPREAGLWRRLAMELEEREDSVSLHAALGRAVEACPSAPDLWIGWARAASDHATARQCLNRARQAMPTSLLIWLAACRLEEAHGANLSQLRVLLQRAKGELERRGALPTPSEWLQQAEACEGSGDLLTAEAMVAELPTTIKAGDEWDWLEEEARACQDRGHGRVARLLVQQALARTAAFSVALWRLALELAPAADRPALYAQASEHPECPAEWWIEWARGEGGEGQTILQRALSLHPANEALWLELLSLDASVLEQALLQCGTVRLWSHAIIQRHLAGDTSGALSVARKAWQQWPRHPLILQRLAELGDPEPAKQALEKFTAEKGEEEVWAWLWATMAQLESTPMRQRAWLERARRRLPQSPLLWLLSIELEQAEGQLSMAKELARRACHQVGEEGALWAQAWRLETEPGQRKALLTQALQHCGSHPHLLPLLDAAEGWERALQATPHDGDLWMVYLQATGNSFTAVPEGGIRWPYWRNRLDQQGETPLAQMQALLDSTL